MNNNNYNDESKRLFERYLGQQQRMYDLKASTERYKEEKRRSWIQFWIPVCISLISLIGAYRQEIAWILQEIAKLLK